MARRGARVRGVALEEALLVLARVDKLLALVDVLLAAVDDAHVAERPAAAEASAPLEQLRRVRAAVHQVELREHAQRAPALRVDLVRARARARARARVRVREGLTLTLTLNF